MVKAMKAIVELFLPLSVYGPAKTMHSASHGVLISILHGKSPYVCVRLLFTWQVLNEFVIDLMVLLIPFQYIATFIISLRWVCPGC
jgi:hypothetical protein